MVEFTFIRRSASFLKHGLVAKRNSMIMAAGVEPPGVESLGVESLGAEPTVVESLSIMYAKGTLPNS